MKLVSVNIAQSEPLKINGRPARTGIFKRPMEGPVYVGKLGLEGDAIVSKKHHGGPDQAVYVYTMPDYDWWSNSLGRELPPGTFGENLTVSGLQSNEINIGDRLRIGAVLLEVTCPRIPCMTLETRMEIRGFAKQFRDTERPGLYCRVLNEGSVQPGDDVTLERFEGKTVSLVELFRDFYQPDPKETAIQHILSAPIAIRARKHKEKQLAGVLARQSE